MVPSPYRTRSNTAKKKASGTAAEASSSALSTSATTWLGGDFDDEAAAGGAAAAGAPAVDPTPSRRATRATPRTNAGVPSPRLDNGADTDVPSSTLGTGGSTARTAAIGASRTPRRCAVTAAAETPTSAAPLAADAPEPPAEVGAVGSAGGQLMESTAADPGGRSRKTPARQKRSAARSETTGTSEHDQAVAPENGSNTIASGTATKSKIRYRYIKQEHNPNEYLKWSFAVCDRDVNGLDADGKPRKTLLRAKNHDGGRHSDMTAFIEAIEDRVEKRKEEKNVNIAWSRYLTVSDAQNLARDNVEAHFRRVVAARGLLTPTELHVARQLAADDPPSEPARRALEMVTACGPLVVLRSSAAPSAVSSAAGGHVFIPGAGVGAVYMYGPPLPSPAAAAAWGHASVAGLAVTAGHNGFAAGAVGGGRGRGAGGHGVGFGPSPPGAAAAGGGGGYDHGCGGGQMMASPYAAAAGSNGPASGAGGCAGDAGLAGGASAFWQQPSTLVPAQGSAGPFSPPPVPPPDQEAMLKEAMINNIQDRERGRLAGERGRLEETKILSQLTQLMAGGNALSPDRQAGDSNDNGDDGDGDDDDDDDDDGDDRKLAPGEQPKM